MAGLPAHQLKRDGRRVRRGTLGHGSDGQVPKVCKDRRGTTSPRVDRQRSQDPKGAKPEEVHGEETGKGPQGARSAEGQARRQHHLRGCTAQRD